MSKISSNIFENIFSLAGNPENRRWGSFGYIGLLTMLGCSIHTSLKFLGIAWIFVKVWAGQFENNNVQTAFTPASSFWALPEFFDNFSSKSKLGFIQKLRCQNFYPVTSPSKSPYIENFHPKRALTLCFYLPTSSCQRSFRMTP